MKSSHSRKFYAPVEKSEIGNIWDTRPLQQINHKTPLTPVEPEVGTAEGDYRQLADKPTRGQLSRGLVNSRTSQLAEMFASVAA